MKFVPYIAILLIIISIVGFFIALNLNKAAISVLNPAYDNYIPGVSSYSISYGDNIDQKEVFLNRAIAWSLNNRVLAEGHNNKPNPGNKEGKIIYLTIDDGPSPIITEKMLDILKVYNVKATFFVIGKLVYGNETVLNRIRDEGHSIGLHSYTHDIKYLYEDQDNFVNEMTKTFNVINEVLGVKTYIIRFPGGSSNHLSKEYVDRLHGLNFKIFDWTISGGDGMYPKNRPDQILANAIEPSQLTSRAILLMHCKPNNENSCEALPGIIEYYINSGYEFKTINESTPEYYFKF